MILFNEDQWSQLHDDTHHVTTTIRRGMRKVLPGPQLAGCGTDIAVLDVTEVSFRLYRDLDLLNATRCGYLTLFAMRQALEAQYPNLNDTEVMTIITIDKVLLK